MNPAVNRLTVKTVPAGMGGVYYGYDLLGDLTSARFDSAGGADAVTASYDGLARLSSTTSTMRGVSRTMGYQYDVLGDVTRLTHPDGLSFPMSYDSLARMSHARWNNIGGGTTLFLCVFRGSWALISRHRGRSGA